MITYSFSANMSGMYSVYYFNPNSASTIEAEFTGKTWSKTDTINNASFYPTGYGILSSMQSIALDGSVTGETSTLTISVYNQIKATSDSSLLNPNPNDYVTVAHSYVIPHRVQ
jgi:hypothetical protein